MSESQPFDLVVIGGGPAGYVGAIRAAQLGLTVACVERDKLGGICLNWGCIPTKALLAGAEFYHRLRHDAKAWGIEADNVRHNWSQVIARSRGVADRLVKGIGALFKKNKITHIQGHATIRRPGMVEVRDANGKTTRTLRSRNTLIATGAVPRGLVTPASSANASDFDGQKIISYKEAMSLPQQPKTLLIVGAGAIGMEFAYFYNAFGTGVTVVEMLDRLLPTEDHEVSREIARAFRKQGIKTLVSHKTLSIEKTAAGICASVAPVKDESKIQTIEADKVLVAIGVKGNCAGLFDPSASGLGIELSKDHIKVDTRNYCTGAAGIYAVGDVIGPPWLAHLASEEAIVCVEKIAGHQPVAIDYDSVPGCTYCHPQVASVGLTEQACQQRGLEYDVGKFPFQASGKAQALGEVTGFAKILTGRKHGEVLGAHLIGDNVTELIAELGLARRLEATAKEIIATIHAHPTLSEAVHEAALGTAGRMIHF